MQIRERINWEDHSASIRKLSHSKKNILQDDSYITDFQQATYSTLIDHNIHIVTSCLQT